MKKLAYILTIICFSCFAFPQTGDAAKESEKQASNGFAWGIGLGAVVILATVIGMVWASSASSPTASHSGQQS